MEIRLAKAKARDDEEERDRTRWLGRIHPVHLRRFLRDIVIQPDMRERYWYIYEDDLVIYLQKTNNLTNDLPGLALFCKENDRYRSYLVHHLHFKMVIRLILKGVFSATPMNGNYLDMNPDILTVETLPIIIPLIKDALMMYGSISKNGPTVTTMLLWLHHLPRRRSFPLIFKAFMEFNYEGLYQFHCFLNHPVCRSDLFQELLRVCDEDFQKDFKPSREYEEDIIDLIKTSKDIYLVKMYFMRYIVANQMPSREIIRATVDNKDDAFRKALLIDSVKNGYFFPFMQEGLSSKAKKELQEYSHSRYQLFKHSFPQASIPIRGLIRIIFMYWGL